MTPIERLRRCVDLGRACKEAEDLAALLAAHDARGELIAAHDDFYGHELTNRAVGPEADRIRAARKATDSAVARVGGGR